MDHKPIDKYKVKLTEVPVDLNETFKRVSCPSCKSLITSDNINIHDKICKCSSCDVIFSLNNEITNLTPNQIKQEVIRPEGIEIFHFRKEMEIAVDQPLTALDIIPFLFTLLFIPGTMLLFQPKVSIIVPIIMLMLASLPIINIINRKKHKIFININEESLDIEWRPRKLIRDKHFNIDTIDQLYTKSGQTHSSLFMIVNSEDGQKHIPLIQQLTSLSKARYLEQEIEKQLGIKDRIVPEEKV